ncbi:MAG: NADH-quinone oxidoreductase subunit L [Acidimicrobiales bacterium]
MVLSLLAAEEAGHAAAEGPWILENIWLVPLLPALSFLTILFFGKRLVGKWKYDGGEIGIAAVGGSFILSLWALLEWIGLSDSEGGTEEAMGALGRVALAGAEEGGHGVEPIVNTHAWLSSGGIEFGVGTFVDGLTVMMLVVVTTVSFLVHIYSTDYVAGDRRYTHFFAFLSLFTASMLFLVMSENVLQLIVGWELVGVCSFVLIGHWWEEKENSDAALKAFLTNRVGDIGLLIGMIVLFFTAGAGVTFSIEAINEAAVSGTNVLGNEVSHTALLVASVALMAAVMSKSGQFFLHTWLPDAMAGPTPVSALIHAATMVVAGVFMIARLYAVFFEGFQIQGSSVNLMAVIGAVTVLVGGSLAFVQNDIKKVLAYSTISQLGYMVLALGVGAWTAALFHLFTHAFFKACLFLGSGSVSHAVHSFDMKKDMGGLRKYMPRTFATFMIGSIALAGLPPFAGFWSKDEILAGTGGWGFESAGEPNGAYTLILIMGMVGAVMTAAYTTRMVYLTFFGEYRGHGEPHESGPRITVPLMILAGLALVAGLINLPGALAPDDVALRFEHWFEPHGVAYFPEIFHAEFSWSLAIFSTLIALFGGLLAWAYYWRNLGPHGFTAKNRAARGGYVLLENKYYLDYLYTDIIAGGTKGPIAKATYWFDQHVLDGIVNAVGRYSVLTGRFVYDKIDQPIIDGAVDASGIVSEAAGGGLRKIETGKVQQYAAIMFAALAVLAGAFIALV